MRKEDFFDASSFQKKKLKTGDKVRFLNSVGGGIVTAFRGKEQVLVEDEDGFEIPVLISECVVVGETGSRLEEAEPPPIKQPEKTVIPQKETFITPKDILFIETPQGERLNLSLAF